MALLNRAANTWHTLAGAARYRTKLLDERARDAERIHLCTNPTFIYLHSGRLYRDFSPLSAALGSTLNASAPGSVETQGSSGRYGVCKEVRCSLVLKEKLSRFSFSRSILLIENIADVHENP